MRTYKIFRLVKKKVGVTDLVFLLFSKKAAFLVIKNTNATMGCVKHHKCYAWQTLKANARTETLRTAYQHPQVTLRRLARLAELSATYCHAGVLKEPATTSLFCRPIIFPLSDSKICLQKQGIPVGLFQVTVHILHSKKPFHSLTPANGTLFL